MDFPRLFSPIKIGGMEVKNRFVVPPMATGLGGFDSTVTDALVAYWGARARGGWGLLIVEFTAVDPLGKAHPAELGVWNDGFIPGFKKLADTVHKYGARIVLQIHHAGRQTNSRIIGAQPVSASPIPCPSNREIPRELTTADVWQLVEQFGDGARRAREAGFDAVEVHGAHGYLVSQFMSAYSNKRTDVFGGSLRGRMRFPVEILKNIRGKVGADYPVLIRLNCEDKIAGGTVVEQSKVMARIAEEAGYDAIDVSVGVYGSMQYIIAPAAVPPGFLLPAVATIKRSVSVPVIGVGRINDPYLAEDAIETGMADLIAMGRQSLADPETPNKVAEGRLDEIAPCTACLEGCAEGLVDPNRLRVGCSINPFTGSESLLKLEQAARKKHVVVVGGGPAGLETAWLAASRGHQVTLYEKAAGLGGQLQIGAIPPAKQDLSRTVAYLARMGEKYGVCFKLNTEATAERILAEKPDAVVLAMGAQPLVPSIEGATGARMVNAWDALDGKKPVGRKVLIVGGGMVGAETADFLGEHGHRVTLVEMLPRIAGDVPRSARFFLVERLKAYGVQVETNTVVEKFLEDGIAATKDGQPVRLAGFDSIVLAMGARSVDGLQGALEGKVAELHVVGDAAVPRKAREAVEAAAAVALKL